MQDLTGFQIQQSTDPSGTVRLMLLGELDLATVGRLTDRLEQLKGEQRSVQLDLSKLSFMDSTGLGTVLTAVLDARREGWQLGIDPTLARPVQRIIDISGANRYLWPEAAI